MHRPTLTKITAPTLPSPPRQKQLNQLFDLPVLPASFDGRSVWGSLLTPIVDQGGCGACYAIANVTAFNDRVNIALNRTIAPLSFQYVVSCLRSRELLGCVGGSIWNGATALVEYPIPYKNTYRLHPSCSLPGLKAQGAFTVSTPSMSIRDAVLAIQREVLLSGPVVSQMYMYEDFYKEWNKELRTQVYSYDGKSRAQGGHAVKIVGWGETAESEKYWIVANSWGKGGYENSGYVLIRRGVNEVGIELNGSVCCQVSKIKIEEQILDAPLFIPWIPFLLLAVLLLGLSLFRYKF